MGLSFSCPFSAYSDLDNGFESVIIKSISLGDEELHTPPRSISFRCQHSHPTIMQSLGSGNMIVERSISSFRTKTREIEIMSPLKAPPSQGKNVYNISIGTERKEMMQNQSPISRLPILDSRNPKHEAAIKLQKVYKSFRTRRKLADCAVLIEQSWWKLLDFAELKRSSISFFDLEKHETAVSRWSRARTRAAKVGKGLSKNGKAQKLALQHWLEAIDPRHRYGHNLHFYYENWLHSQSKEPFFYWLDIGEGKEVNLVDKCSRLRLQQQCIKYLGPMERKVYEVVVENGKLLYNQTGELLDTTGDSKGTKSIFVLSTSRVLYVGKKKKGTFQHSSFLAGGATSAAGRIVVEKGVLKAVWPHSGHYRPTPENFQEFISFLRDNNVDLSDVKMDDSEDDEEEALGKKNSVHLRNNSSEDDFAEKDGLETEENQEIDVQDLINSTEEAALEQPKSKRPTNLEIPKKDDLLEILKSENQMVESNSGLDGYETAEESFGSEQEHEESKEEIIPDEAILQRINSHKETKSYQLGKQLSCNWSTGAGPRIGCLRDYPTELQSHALEQVDLSPRSARCLRSNFSPRVPTPTCFRREKQVITSPHPLEKRLFYQRSSRHLRAHSTPLCKGTSATSSNDKPS